MLYSGVLFRKGTYPVNSCSTKSSMNALAGEGVFSLAVVEMIVDLLLRKDLTSNFTLSMYSSAHKS